MDKTSISVGIGMLVVPFLMVGIVYLISTLIGLGIIAIFGICIITYVLTALFLIVRGCLK